MFGIHDFGVFLASCVVFTLSPGQDTLYILGRSLAQGRAAGVASVLGISSGIFVHTFAAAFGLAALVATSPSAFLVIKLLGAAYLIYLGARLLIDRSVGTTLPDEFGAGDFSKCYRQGLVTNLLNPKVALFYLAFIPQFITAETSQKFPAFILLGLWFLAIGTTWSFCIVFFASPLGAKLRGDAKFARTLNRCAGALFILLGLRLAITP